MNDLSEYLLVLDGDLEDLQTAIYDALSVVDPDTQALAQETGHVVATTFNIDVFTALNDAIARNEELSSRYTSADDFRTDLYEIAYVLQILRDELEKPPVPRVIPGQRPRLVLIRGGLDD